MKHGYETTGIGKIKDIFAGRGITRHIPSRNNTEGIRLIIEAIDSEVRGLIFANLVDFDMKYGHRNDPAGYARALEEVDRAIPVMTEKTSGGDVLILYCRPWVRPDHSQYRSLTGVRAAPGYREKGQDWDQPGSAG